MIILSGYQSKESEQPLKKNYWKRVLIIMLIIICSIILTFTCILFIHRENARRILKEAKLVELAVKTVGVEYYGINRCIYNPATSNGLTEGAIEEISSLSGCSGQVYLIEWDADNHKASHLAYIKDDFIVDYVCINGKDIWNVYQLKHVIIH